MHYIEFYDRKLGVALDDFHSVTLSSFREWSRRNPEDELVANLGRTWRLGPYPYFLIWRCSGFGRLGEWNTLFSSGAVDDIEDPILEVMTTFDAGFYREMRPAVPVEGEFFYLETFVNREGTAESYEKRAEGHGFALNLLLQRVALLGPDPGGVALFSLPSLDALEEIASSAAEDVKRVGLYAPAGQEIL